MGRKLTLKPRFDHARGKWVLSIPANLSPTGKRRRLFWDRGEEAEAIKHAENLRTGLVHFKARAKDIRPDLMEAAIKWNDVVIEYGFHGLEHFCASKIAELKAVSASPPLSELLNAFEADHSKNWSTDYTTKRWKPFRRRLHEIEEEKISTLDEARWRTWFADWHKSSKPSPGTYNQQLGTLRSLFDLSTAKRFHPINPLHDLPGKADKRGSVPVSLPAAVLRLLLTAWQHAIHHLWCMALPRHPPSPPRA